MGLNGTVWTPIGPSPIAQGSSPVSGLVSAIAINPSNSNLIYIGTAGGGVWRTDDGGTSWNPIFDRQLSLGVGEPGALAIDPNNTDVIYVGTSRRVSAQPQAGLFKSTDGGTTWRPINRGLTSQHIPDPTTAARSSAVPRPSATRRRESGGRVSIRTRSTPPRRRAASRSRWRRASSATSACRAARSSG